MRTTTSIVALLLLIGGSGCVSEQYGQFKGTILHGGREATVPGKPYDIGTQFGYRPDNVELGLWGFGLPDGGSVVLLFDRARVVSDGYRLSNQTVRDVWYLDSSLPDNFDWTQFLRLKDDERERRRDGVPMHGTVDVQRWNNNIDLRVRLAMSSPGPESVGINGVIDYHTNQEWHPLEAIALFLSQFGIGSS